MNEKQVMVVGASGVIGNSAVTHFLDQGWDVLALSRRPPDAPASEKLTHLSVDLLDAESCRQMVSLLPGATPVVYSALFEKPGLVAGWREADQMATNLQMLENLLDPMIADGKLGRLILLQGTKAYGSHLHDIRIPSK
jgi:nucleoside-diphosphate-sugar epimerase